VQRTLFLQRPPRPLPAIVAIESALMPWLWGGVVILGAVLRLVHLRRPGLHPDEALYASWALRIADGSDPLLLGVAVDKPPLLLYGLAGLFRLADLASAGGVQHDSLVLWGRWAAVVASVASLVLLHAIGQRLYGRRVALLATTLYALSPLAVGLSPTLFTDPWLVLWMLLGVWAVLARRPWLTGLACGLAYATKQPALLLVPLLFASWIVQHGPYARTISHSRLRFLPGRNAWRVVNGFLLVVVLVTWWDSQRWQWLPSFWDRSHTSYGGLTLVRGGGFFLRLEKWTELLQLTLGSSILLALLAIALLVILGYGLKNVANSRRCRFDLLLVTFVLGYLLVHLVFTLAPWDRYALPLAPLLSLALARGLSLIVRSLGRSSLLRGRRAWIWQGTSLMVLAMALVQGMGPSLLGNMLVGDARAYDGAGAVAAYVRGYEPADVVLYHHWLGWHYQFYLHDSPIELRWWESAEDLAVKVGSDPSRAQLVALPAGRETKTWLQALKAADLQLVPLIEILHADGSPSLTLHRLDRASAGVPPS
jgi:4-amino-4-deoxy-L-arabinose transferase-like glycosyltransferase